MQAMELEVECTEMFLRFFKYLKCIGQQRLTEGEGVLQLEVEGERVGAGRSAAQGAGQVR